MNTASRTVLALALSLSLGAVSLGCAHAPPAFSASDLASNKEATLKKYVDVDNEDVFKKMGSKVYIGQFQVEYISSSAAAASSYSSSSGNSTSLHVTYNLKDVDASMFQALTDGLYQGFVADLKSRGVDTVSIDELKGKDQYQKLMTKSEVNGSEQPSRLQAEQSAKALVFAPTGMPVLYTNFNPRLTVASIFGGISGDQPENFIANLSDEMKVPVVAVQMIVGFAQLKASGSNGNSSVGATFRFSIAPKQTVMQVVLADNMSIDSSKKRSGVKWNKGAKVWLKEPIFSDKGFDKSVTDATATSTKVVEGVANAFSALAALSTGNGSHSSSTKVYDLHADPAAYKTLADQNLGYTRTMFMFMVDKNK